MSSEDVRLDWQRSDRLGISEAIWGLHKTVDQIVAILEAFAARDQPALVTRVDESKAKAVLERCNTQLVHFEARARCLTSGTCLLYTSPSPRDLSTSRMPSSA